MTFIFHVILYLTFCFLILKIVETGISIRDRLKGRTEKIVREITTVEKKKIEPVIKEFKPSTVIETVIEEGRAKLVCPKHGCDVVITIDGEVHCPECEKDNGKKSKRKKGGENDQES